MSRLDATPPVCSERNDAVALLIEGRARDLGGFSVRPQPHIGLATVTYLFEG